MKQTVVVIQPYVPAYRRPFFLSLRERLQAANIDLVVAVGMPAGAQAARQDRADLPDLVRLPEWRWSLRGRSIAYRDVRAVVAEADLVVLEQARSNVEMYRLLLGPRKVRRVALWGHGRTVSRRASYWEHKLLDHFTKRADWFFAYTDAGVRHLVAIGFPEDRCTIVHNATDTRALRSAVKSVRPDHLEAFRRVHGLVPSLTALFVGGLDGSKRIDFLLDAAGRIASEVPGFRLLVVGQGVQEAKVRTAQRVGSPVVFLGDRRGNELAIAACASEMILMPGRVGLVAVDSFAIGLPIVTTNWPHHAPEFEYLTPGKNSVVSADDVASYVAEVISLAKDSDRRRVLQAACVEQSVNYSIEKMVSNFVGGIDAALEMD
ncbi:MAG: glycosyltransferase family 4 protein [Actinomycetota bacterium]